MVSLSKTGSLDAAFQKGGAAHAAPQQARPRALAEADTKPPQVGRSVSAVLLKLGRFAVAAEIRLCAKFALLARPCRASIHQTLLNVEPANRVLPLATRLKQARQGLQQSPTAPLCANHPWAAARTPRSGTLCRPSAATASRTRADTSRRNSAAAIPPPAGCTEQTAQAGQTRRTPKDRRVHPPLCRQRQPRPAEPRTSLQAQPLLQQSSR